MESVKKEIKRAEKFANLAHAGQKRKITGEPYITHPAAVARLLTKYGFNKYQIAAAWLHDTVEDTKTKTKTIRTNFDKRTARYVAIATRPKGTDSWKKGRRYTIKVVKRAKNFDDIAVIIADKIVNVEDITRNLRKQGMSLFDKFFDGKYRRQLWYYEAVLKAIHKRDKNRPIVLIGSKKYPHSLPNSSQT